MALYVSCNPALLIFGLRAPQPEYHPATGEVVGEKQGIDVQFNHGGCPSWAADVALAYGPFRRRWNCLPDGTEPRSYIGWYDTDVEADRHGWTADDKSFVEDVLDRHYWNGNRFIRAESAEEQQIAPWPGYEKMQWKKIVGVAQDTGADLGYVLEYEQTHGNRPGVVAALEEAIGGPLVVVEA